MNRLENVTNLMVVDKTRVLTGEIMKIEISKYDESKTIIGKLFVGDKLFARSEDEAYMISNLLSTSGIQTRVGYNMESEEWSVAIIYIPDGDYKKLSEISI